MLSPNANSFVLALFTIAALYPSDCPLTELYSIGVAALIANCAPATGRAAPFESSTVTSILTVSPGLAFTVGMFQEISPSNFSSSTIIAPSVKLTLFVISLPFVSLTKAFDQATSYVPPGVPSGTL